MTMYKALKCRLTGHVFVDSRSQPGVQVCARCRHRQAFEGLKPASAAAEQRADERSTDLEPDSDLTVKP